MEDMIVSHVYKSLHRTPTMSSMPTKWLVANIFSWIGISVYIALEISIYAAAIGIVGVILTTFLLQKAFLKDDHLFGVYWRHYWQEGYYPALSRFNYEEPEKKLK